MNIQHTIALILLICSLNNLHGQTIVTDRPDQTESSSTVGLNNLQIESGILMGFTGEGEQSNRQLLAPTNLFRYGLTKGFELRILSQFESLKNEATSFKTNGISDLEVGFKAQVFQKENVNTEIAFLSHLILPTGSDGLSNDEYGTINKLSISHQLNDLIGLGYNIGYNYFGTGDGDFTYSIALGVSINDKIGIYIEPYGEVVEFNDHQASFDAGFTYLLKDNLQADFSFGTGINHDMNYISIGISALMRSSSGKSL